MHGCCDEKTGGLDLDAESGPLKLFGRRLGLQPHPTREGEEPYRTSQFPRCLAFETYCSPSFRYNSGRPRRSCLQLLANEDVASDVVNREELLAVADGNQKARYRRVNDLGQEVENQGQYHICGEKGSQQRSRSASTATRYSQGQTAAAMSAPIKLSAPRRLSNRSRDGSDSKLKRRDGEGMLQVLLFVSGV